MDLYLPVSHLHGKGVPASFITRADGPMFMQPPAVEEFGTGNLGPGLKVLGYSRDKDVVTGHLAYAWRSEELAIALRMFTGGPDPGRLQAALPDIEDLARAVAWVPLEPDSEHGAS